jgi:hypothetical protein
MLIKPKFASLTAGLLARKGEAHPAATTELTDELTRGAFLTPSSLTPSPTVEPPSIQTPVEQQAFLIKAFEAPAPPNPNWARSQSLPPLDPVRTPATCDTKDEAQRCPACPTDPMDERRFHVSVRLKRGRYLRLKLAAASLHKPSQEIIGEALDAYFAKLGPDVLGDCPCLHR